MTARVVVPAGDLEALNANQRLHWAARSVRTAAWRAKAAAALTQAEIPAYTRAHIFCHVAFPDQRRRDVHNWYPTAKACVDGFIDAGLLPDDDDQHLIGPDMRRAPNAGELTFHFEIREHPQGDHAC